MLKQIGNEFFKNTGKYLSNLVFGDKHSTPHKIIRGGSSKEKTDSGNSYTKNEDDELSNEVNRVNYESILSYIQETEIDVEVDKTIKINNYLETLLCYYDSDEIRYNKKIRKIIKNRAELLLNSMKNSELFSSDTDMQFLYKQYKNSFKDYSILLICSVIAISLTILTFLK